MELGLRLFKHKRLGLLESRPGILANQKSFSKCLPAATA